MQTNILGTNLEICCTSPMTGFYRDGVCRTSPEDTSKHTVCAILTNEFLEYSKAQGNDLTTPMPQLKMRLNIRKRLINSLNLCRAHVHHVTLQIRLFTGKKTVLNFV